jgi:hypothetical protein
VGSQYQKFTTPISDFVVPSQTSKEPIMKNDPQLKMDELHSATKEGIAAADSKSHMSGQPEKLGQYPATPSSLTSSSEDKDDLDLQKLGYKSVLARGWGSFDNFACSFSALYCIGGIRVLFYIALSNGGPAAL